MTLVTNGDGQIQKAPADTLARTLKMVEGEIARALPKHITPDRMARVMLTAVRTVKNLSACDTPSFLGCVMSLAQLGLEPNTPLGHAYLIPRRNKKSGGFQCTVIIGYQGYLDIARRSGLVTSIYAHCVHEGDEFEYALGLRPDLKHIPKGKVRTPETYTHVYAVAHLRDAEPIFVVLTRDEVDARRRRSMAGDDGPWVTDLLAMVRKTSIRALWTWLPKSAEMARSAEYDDYADRSRAPVPDIDDTTARALLSAGVVIQGETIDTEFDPETGEVT